MTSVLLQFCTAAFNCTAQRITGLSNGGSTTRVFEELEESGFITKSFPFDRKRKTSAYWLTDNYSLFYLQFIKDKKASGEGSWINRIDNPAWKAWK